MTPPKYGTHPGTPSKYPLLVASRYRSWLDWKRLEIGRRMRIKATRHSKGYYFKPTDPTDAWAVEWIDALASRYGTLKWTKRGWVKEKTKKVSKDV